MPDLPLSRVTLIGLVFGFSVAFGWIGAVAARAAWSVTRGGRWYQVKNL